MTISIVQQAALTNLQNKTVAQTIALTGVTAGNTVFVLCAYDDGNNTSTDPASMTDSVGGALTQDVETNRSHNSAAIYSLWNVASGAHTVSSAPGAGAKGNWTWTMLEVTGLGPTNTIDQTGSANPTSTASAVSTAGPTTQPIELALCLCESGGVVTGYVTPTQNGGWNNLGLLNSSFPSGSFASLITSSAGVLSPTFGTLSGSGFAAVIATYAAAAVAVPTPFSQTQFFSQDRVVHY